jgi:hypothetical protein
VTNGPQREGDPYDGNPGEDRHGPAGPRGRQDQLEQRHRVTQALLKRAERAVPSSDYESNAFGREDADGSVKQGVAASGQGTRPYVPKATQFDDGDHRVAGS